MPARGVLAQLEISMSSSNHDDASSPQQAFRPVGLLDILITQLNKGQFGTEGPQRTTKVDRSRADIDDDSALANDND